MTITSTRSPPDGALLRDIHSALAKNEVDRATSLAEAALMAGQEDALLLNLTAHRREIEGRYPAAMALLNRALRLTPNDPYILNNFAGVLSKAGRPREALVLFDAALGVEPNFVLAHHGRGLALAALGDTANAWTAHARANALDPNYPDPLGALAALAAEGGDYAVARSLARRALTLDPGQVAATLSLATVALHEGHYVDVIDDVGKLLAATSLPALDLAAAERLRAGALDAMDRYDEAMSAYRSANRSLRSLYMQGVEESGVELGVELCARLGDHFKTAPPGWRAPPRTPPVTRGGIVEHIFLLGFHRSGTTLLEQVLATHPDISALEERPTLDPILHHYFADEAALDRLANLDGDDLKRERENYWKRVDLFDVDTTKRVFIDKMPLSTIYLPLIAKLFPSSKIILALRDPRDVVVSCFRHNFRASTLVVEYTDLMRTARLYDGVMKLADLYRGALPLPFYVHRHESLVEDFDTEARALCDFLNVTWRDDLRDFVATAQRRNIHTPSVNQVRRGLYREGMGQWRRYRSHLKDVLPVLEPWVERFGYPSTDDPIAPES